MSLDLGKLKKIRQEKGLSQMEIAKTVGVTLNAYIRWEQGCSNPTPENFEKLENLLCK